MTCFAIGNLTEVTIGPDIVRYLAEIDATLGPFEGRFLLHGGEKIMLEGVWQGDLIVIAFPDRVAAHGWYHSEAYQRILPLRIQNAVGAVMLMEGVGSDHCAADVLN